MERSENECGVKVGKEGTTLALELAKLETSSEYV